jgi:hypothetical protein
MPRSFVGRGGRGGKGRAEPRATADRVNWAHSDTGNCLGQLVTARTISVGWMSEAGRPEQQLLARYSKPVEQSTLYRCSILQYCTCTQYLGTLPEKRDGGNSTKLLVKKEEGPAPFNLLRQVRCETSIKSDLNGAQVAGCLPLPLLLWPCGRDQKAARRYCAVLCTAGWMTNWGVYVYGTDSLELAAARCLRLQQAGCCSLQCKGRAEGQVGQHVTAMV